MQQFLDDDAFTRLQSPLAQNADKTATELAQWCRNSKNQLFLQLFAADLLQLFEKVMKPPANHNKRTERISGKLSTSFEVQNHMNASGYNS